MRASLKVASAAMWILVWTHGCSDAEQAARRLDDVAGSIERYGFASISTPFLVGPHEGFGFKLKKEADEYFNLAMKPQGSVRHYEAEAFDVQVALRFDAEQAILLWNQLQRARDINQVREAKRQAAVQQDRLNAIAPLIVNDADKKLVEATQGLLTATAEQPEPSTEALPGFSPSNEKKEPLLPIPAADRVALTAVKPSFSDALAMSNDAMQLSAREAILTSAGDIMTQSLLGWFINPEKNKQGDCELFFCPIIVSVQPGTETRRGYLADITVGVDLARADNGSLTYLSEFFPHSGPPIQVVGVFPALDSQVLDLANSRRQLFAMAMHLAAMGFGAQAEAFSDYARKLEQDAKTRTSLTVASSYTVGSNCFGFRVEPKFVASADPTQLQTEPGEILESRTFPAMAMVLIHRSYLHDKKEMRNGADGKKVKLTHLPVIGDAPARSGMRADRSGEDAGLFDYLVFRTSVRWAPARGRLGPRCSELEALRRAEAIEDAERIIGRCEQRKPSTNWDLLASRAMSLRKLALDSQALVRVSHSRESRDEPAKAAELVSVKDRSPAQGWWDQCTVLTLSGKGFAQNVKGVVVGGVSCEFAIVSDCQVVALVPPWGERCKRLPPLPGATASASSGASRTDLADCPADSRDGAFRAQIQLISTKPVSWGDQAQAGQTVAPARAGAGDAPVDHALAWISFDRKLPPRVLANQGSITFSRDSGGRITGVQTGDGGFDHGHELLKAMIEVGKSDPRFKMEFEGSGTVQLNPKPASSNPADSSNPAEKSNRP